MVKLYIIYHVSRNVWNFIQAKSKAEPAPEGKEQRKTGVEGVELRLKVHSLPTAILQSYN